MRGQSTFAPRLVATSEPGVNGRGIADRIASSISLGMLSVGDRLPTEAELAEQFGVAVATLRTALATLRERGLVETRRGRSGGTFIVRTPFPAAHEVTAHLGRTSIVELRDLGDEHVAIGCAVAKLACSRVYGGGIARLADFAARLRFAETPTARASADSRFHIELAVLAQSPRLMHSELRLQSEIGPLLWSVDNTRTNLETALAEHAELIEAIGSGDATRAERVVESHYRRGVARLIDAKLSLDPTMPLFPHELTIASPPGDGRRPQS
jgi:GntR family transcriptional regulator, transcriptional repressor for pyruvate dehydrogenase complex